MRSPIIMVTAAILLAGCAASSIRIENEYGNFAAGTPPAHEKQLADDAARQMQILLPPASTRLDLRQSLADGFGRQLAELLRGQGYAIQEFISPAVAPPAAVAMPVTPAADLPGTAAGVRFNYVVDTVASPKLYRVTLILGSQTITRAYVPQNDTVHPAGAWVRKE